MDSPQISDKSWRQNCVGFLYRPVECYKSNPTRALLVLGFICFTCLCILYFLPLGTIIPWFIYVLLAILAILAIIAARRCFLQRKQRQDRFSLNANEPMLDDFDGDYLKNLTGLPTIFSFEALKTATGNFSKEIGRGGFGKVYEGTLMDGTQVAVKCLLNQTGHGQREFCAEIATISSLNHSNLVSLCGVCVEGQHRILVYEFMSNGSLDRWLFSSEEKLDWKTRYSIALDTARGLAYLHEDSRLGILHLDVKPQNILLDEDFKAKVSDFGMARSLKRDLESRVVTQVRGTPGYIAPDWFWDRGITYKTDVFSYGMVLLEIIRGSRNVDRSQDSENWYFPSIAVQKARQGKMDELIESGLVKRPEEMDEACRLIKTALWCIQSNSAMRPSMGMVVQLLEGNLEIMDPPLDCTLTFGPSLDDSHQASMFMPSDGRETESTVNYISLP